MSDDTRDAPGMTRVAWTAEVDRICDRFEAEWRSGRPRAISEHVACVDAALRPALAAELEIIDRELRQSSDMGAESADTRRPALLRALSDSPTFALLEPEPIAALADVLERRTVTAGDAVLVQGEPCTGLHILLRGRIAIELDDAAGTRRRIDEASPGSVVGEIGLLTGQPCTAHVMAIEDSDLLTLPAGSFSDLRNRHPELELALAQVVGDRLGEREFDGLCGKVVGPCRLIRCLGRGGMGVVYEARLVDGGGEVAVKMLRHGLAHDVRAVERFRSEAKVLRGLRHRGVVGVADLFVEYQTLFLVMELCRGTDLRRLIATQGALPPSVVRRLLGQIAAALAHAHARSVVHLDVKPSNVLLDESGGVKLVDFGLARMLADPDGGGLSGTPRYMPPEQLAGGAVGPASDWYAFACLAGELLAGRPLFDDEDLVAMATAKAAWPPRLDHPWTAADPELAAMLEAALHPLPERRQLDLDAVAQWAGPVVEHASRDRPSS